MDQQAGQTSATDTPTEARKTRNASLAVTAVPLVLLSTLHTHASH